MRDGKQPGKRMAPDLGSDMSIRIQILAAAIALSVAATGVAQTATGQASGTQNAYDLPSQPLADALKAIGAQANINVLMAPQIVDGRQAPALKANLTVDQAIAKLLQGTGITYRYLSDKTIVLAESKPTAQLSEQDPIRLAQAEAARGSHGSQGPASRGSDSAASSSDTPENQQLEEVTVTGTRQQLYSSRVVTSGVLGDKDPIDVPFSISSYTSELAKLQANYTPAQIFKNDPSAQNQGNFAGWQNNVVLRGFPASQGATRRDGLFTEHESDFPIEIYDRIELIKGVGGFLYGFAEPGGVMNYITKRPTKDPFATVDVRYFDGSGIYTHLDTGGPIGEGRFGYRANVVYQDNDNFSHPDDLKRFVASLALDAKINDLLLLRFDASHSNREQPGYLGLPLTTAGTEPPRFDQSHLPVPPWARSKWESSRAALRADYTPSDDWTIQAQVGYDKVADHLTFGFMTSLTPEGDYQELVFNIKDPRNFWRYTDKTAQLFAIGKLRTGSVTHELAFGGFLRKQKYDYLSSDGPFAFVTGNLHSPNFDSRPILPADPVSVTDGANITEKHIFVGDTIHFGERWQVMVGARHVDSNSVVETQNANKTTPSAALLFKPTAAMSLYGSYARSLQYGTKSPFLDGSGIEIVNPNELQPPIEAEQYEVGAKTRLTSGLDLALAVYRIKLPTDYLDPTTRVYGRFGEQVSQGVELTAAGNIRPNLAIVAGLGYLDAELSRNADPTLDGNKAAAVAKMTANLFVNYGVTSVPGLSLNGGLYRVGKRYLDLENNVPVDGYLRTDLGVQYRFQSFARNFTLRANVNNVFDKFYWEGLGPFLHRYSPGQGRTFILAAQMDLF